MAATVYDLLIAQGSSYSLLYTVTDTGGTARNLTGYSARGVIKYRYSSSTAIMNLEPNVVVPASGMVLLALGADDTESLPAGNLYYDVEIYTSITGAERVLQGKAIVDPEITNTDVVIQVVPVTGDNYRFQNGHLQVWDGAITGYRAVGAYDQQLVLGPPDYT